MRWKARSIVWASLGLGACHTVAPTEVPEPAAAHGAIAAHADFPGAARMLTGIDMGGEPQLRDGDRALYALELVAGERVERRLLVVQAELGDPLLLGSMQFTVNDEPVGAARIARPVHLGLTLFDVDGHELQRSRTPAANTFVLGASFVADLAAARDPRSPEHVLAIGRLVEIVNLLQQDTILRELLAAAASVPWDPRLLWRRELRLVARFEAATAVPWAANDPRSPLQAPHALPFDLLLNDSVFVRASTVVVEPHGALAAVGGITELFAQQATDPRRQVRLQLLAAARGPATDWQRHGRLAALGACDRGVALAFSPDARWLATPGDGGVVELRDLRLADPTLPRHVSGAAGPIADLAFLDDRTLLVARGDVLEAHDVLGPVDAVPRTFRTEAKIHALEATADRTCFVGLHGSEVQRWSFAMGSEPLREVVCTAERATATIGDVAVPFELAPQRDFLVAGAAGTRVVVRRGWFAEAVHDVVYERAADGTWSGVEATTLSTPAPPTLPGVFSWPTGQVRPNGVPSERVLRWRSALPMAGERTRKASGVCVAGGHSLAMGGDCICLSVNVGNHSSVNQLKKSWFRGAAIGFDPSGRFAAVVASGCTLLFDCEAERRPAASGGTAP